MALLSQLAIVSASDERTILVLYSDPSLMPATAAFTEGLRAGTESAGLLLEAQYLDISRFTADTDERAFAEWLAARYRNRRIPVVIPVGVPGSRFASTFGAMIWPYARIVHAAIDGEQLAEVRQRGEPAVPRILAYRRTVEAAMTLLPNVRQVNLIAGATAADRRWLDQAEADLAPLPGVFRLISWPDAGGGRCSRRLPSFRRMRSCFLSPSSPMPPTGPS